MCKKVIIVGSGVGGLSTAVKLLSHGYEVEIFEKENNIGGKVNLIEEDDFRFDLTASILMMPEIYKEPFKWCKKDYKDYLEFIRLDPIYRVFYSDGNTYDFSSDLVKLTKTLESISNKDSNGYIKFLGESYEKYLIANEYFLQKTFEDFNDFFNIKTIKEALKTKTLSTTYDYVSKHIKSEKLKQFLCFQSMYVGISPFNGPNIYTLVPAISQIHGLWHLKGGMYSYIKALEKLIYEFGGTIHTNTNVEEVLISDDKAVGVKTNSSTIKGDVVVCNADFSYSMKNLIRDKKEKGKYIDKNISKMKYSCSTFIMYLGLNKKYDNLLVHNHFIGNDFRINLEAPFKGFLPKDPSLYIYCPTRIDENMSEENRECLNVMVRVPNLLFDNIKWNNKTIKYLREKLIKTLSSIKGLEDIEDHIIYENYLTPEDLRDKFNSYGGAAYGLSHTLTQTNYFRPHLKSETVENLYFVGESVHPGTGVSIVLQCSKLVTDLINSQYNS